MNTDSNKGTNNEDSTPFSCSNCNFTVNCHFGKLEFEKNKYVGEWYYLKNPFELPDKHKAQKDFSVGDFIVIASSCHICSRLICVDEECSLFYKHLYCLNCVWREWRSFPDALLTNMRKQKTDKTTD